MHILKISPEDIPNGEGQKLHCEDRAATSESCIASRVAILEENISVGCISSEKLGIVYLSSVLLLCRKAGYDV